MRFYKLYLLVFLSPLLFAGNVRADTVISSGYLYNSVTWTASGSPYIIEDTVTIPNGFSLSVEPGVRIVGSSTVEGYSIIENHGSLQLLGTKDEPVEVKGFGQLMTWSGNTTIRNADISLAGGVGVLKGSLDISSSTITGANIGISFSSGQANIFGTTLTGNAVGIKVQGNSIGPVPMMMSANTSAPVSAKAGSDSSNKAVASGQVISANTNQSVAELNFHINDSNIVDNTIAINNANTSYIDATHNWWGSSSGPETVGMNKIIGPVNFKPWIEQDPLEKPKPCCSNILFIPGIEGSRLYTNEGSASRPIINQLWEPNRNADVKKLYLDKNGSSTDKKIYSGGPIDKALGIFDVYGKFLIFLDDLKNNGTINTWKSFGYDWRQPIPDVINLNQKKSVGFENIQQVVEDLASTSRTHKVTVIAHSNGGLVATYLVKYLSQIGRENLIDSVISVAVPNLGTPEAILGLLHGDDQAIASGLILSKSVARDLGINMSSVYSLLPSKEYFRQVFSPTIAFASTNIRGLNDGSYPKTITSNDDQSHFIVDSSNLRKVPKSSDTNTPIKGNSNLVASANLVHDIIDSFSWPSSILHLAILGWNKITAKGIEYKAPELCQGIGGKFECGKALTHQASTTIMGDGTVIAKSASYNSQMVVSEDLKQIGQKENDNFSHVNILNASTTQNVILNTLKNGSTKSDLPSGATWGEPDYSKDNALFVVRTHSPVELHVYDSSGKHTGVIAKPANLDAENGLYQFYEENIPGSKFENNGGPEYAPETSIYLPVENGQNYQVQIKGIGTGEFSYDESLIVNGATVASKEYNNLPATPLLEASTSLSQNTLENSSSTDLMLDLSGDGKDVLKLAAGSMDQKTYSSLMAKFVGRFGGRNKDWDSKIKKIRDYLKGLENQKGYKRQPEISDDVIGHRRYSNITDPDRKNIIDAVIRDFNL